MGVSGGGDFVTPHLPEQETNFTRSLTRRRTRPIQGIMLETHQLPQILLLYNGTLNSLVMASLSTGVTRCSLFPTIVDRPRDATQLCPLDVESPS